MKKKIIFVLAAAVMAFVCTFSFAGCELASNVQKNCNHTWIKDKNSSSLRAATCSEEGISAVYNCIKCQKTRYEYSPKLPHTFDDENFYRFSCGASSAIQQKCKVCNEVVTVRLPVAVHNFGTPVYHEAYEATLVDIGLYTQEEYEELPSDVIESCKFNHLTEIREKSTCAYTERKCSSCGYSEKNYEHYLSEYDQSIIEEMENQAHESGVCGSTLTLECQFCNDPVQYFFHTYTDTEVIYASSKFIIKKLNCIYCQIEEKYEVEYLN